MSTINSTATRFTKIKIQYFNKSTTYYPIIGIQYCIVEVVWVCGGSGSGGVLMVVLEFQEVREGIRLLVPFWELQEGLDEVM